MLSRSIKRALLDSQWSVPPTFLLPWAAGLTTVSHTPTSTEISNPPSVLPQQQTIKRTKPSTCITPSSNRQASTTSAPADDFSSDASALPPPPAQQAFKSSPPALSPSVRELLPVLKAQGSHYISAHIYDRPYLVTQGDTIRLPFHMSDVVPGDILRLDKASIIGSRDFTLKASAAAPSYKSPTTTTTMVVDPTSGHLESESRVMPTTPELASTASRTYAPHFIPHIAKGKVSYLDDRFFVCRAVVMGVESEPMRIKEKTKRRQRKVKTVKSKHKYTILKIKELRIRDVEEIESGQIE